MSASLFRLLMTFLYANSCVSERTHNSGTFNSSQIQFAMRTHLIYKNSFVLKRPGELSLLSSTLRIACSMDCVYSSMPAFIVILALCFHL